MDGETLEAMLKRHWYNNSVVKVLDVDSAPALAKGENYTTSVLRAKAKVLLGSGEISYVHLVVKKRLEGPEVPDSFKYLMALLINMEYMTYTQILPTYEKLLKDAKEVDTKLWPDAIGCKPSDEIYFSDLKILGYRMAVRQVGLDLEHALLVMQSLGKMHAASKVALYRGMFHKCSGRKLFLIRNDDTVRNFIVGALEAVVDVIRNEWPKQWSHFADKLEIFSDNIGCKLEMLGEVDDKNINVYNHGDCWVNNMMFKYSADNKPISIKFIDFQLCHYNSFAMDLVYFLFSSVHPDLRSEHLGDLTSAYLSSYTRVASALEPGLEPMTRDTLEAEVQRLLPVAAVVTVWLRSVVMCDKEEDVLPIFEMFAGGKDSPGKVLFRNPKYADALRKDLSYIFSNIQHSWL